MASKDFFIGKHERTIDDKGRLLLPKSFRGQLGKTCFISQLQGIKCVGIWTSEEFYSTMKRLQAFAENEIDGQDQLRLFSASAHMVNLDSKLGRIMIPQPHREAAELQKDVLVCGAASRVEIWNPTNWQDFSEGVGQNKETWL